MKLLEERPGKLEKLIAVILENFVWNVSSKDKIIMFIII